MEKPKLTKEMVFNLYHRARVLDFVPFERELIDAGYMEKPETALERAERLYKTWQDAQNTVIADQIVGEIMAAFREAIAEMAKAKEAAE